MEQLKTNVLRIYISSTDKTDGILLYERIVKLAKEKNMGGATVLKGVMGFGASSSIYSYRFWEITEKLPVVVELIDEKTKIDTFFPELKELLEASEKGCLVTFQEVGVKMYKSGKKK
jgi:PII-like signaling protein